MRSDGTLWAAPFDADRLELKGLPVVLVEGVFVEDFGGEGHYALSETGTLVYRTETLGGQQAVWVDQHGEATPIDSQWRGDFFSFSLSPDGARLAATLTTPGYQEIWVKQLDRGPLTQLTFEGSANYRAEWTADGRSVTFISDRSGRVALWMKRADGSAPAELLVDHDRTIDQGFWSRDGRWVVFRTGAVVSVRGISTRSDLGRIAYRARWSHPSSTSMPRRLSPDGRWLAYVSEESGRQEVYVRPFPETDEGKSQVSVDGGRGPVWAHSGRKLFYQTERGDVIVTDLVLEPAFAVGSRRVLIQGADYVGHRYHPMFDVTADEQRFVMIRKAEVQESELILVLNFFEELKAKVGN